MTSEGIIKALNTLFAAEEPAAEVPAEEPAAEEPVVEAPAADVPTQDMSVTGEEGPVAPNAATITVPGYAGKDVVVTVTFAEDGTVAALVIDASTQSPGLGMKCAEEGFVEQFIGKAAPFTLGEGVDAVSYATITSQAIVDAVNAAAAE
jgi:Na+-translocating ferredoxin:NAD+ oxidoreductase RnfG subunit